MQRMILIFLCVLLMPGMVPAAHAAGPPPSPLTGENLFIFQEDKVITGVSNQQDYYFEASPDRKITAGSVLLLQFSHSSTLIPNRSTVTVLLDGVPLGSKYLDQTNVALTTWKLDISKQPLKPGFHSLSIKTRMEVTGNVCQDQNNEANWLILHRESVLHLNLQNVYQTADLSWYPAPFLEKSSPTPLKAVFVVPDLVDRVEIQALSRITQYFSKQVPGASLSFSVYRESEVPKALLQSRDLIFLGERLKWRGIGMDLLKAFKVHVSRASGASGAAGGSGNGGGIGSGSGSGSGSGVQNSGVQVGVSPWNSAKSALLITGDADEVANASVLLSDSRLVPQLHGNELNTKDMVTASPEKDGEVWKDKMTLGDLGYQDLVIESLAVGSAFFTYSLPKEWEVTGNGRLHLSFKHSKTLNFAQSLVVVRLNGVPVASRYLTEETSDVGVLDVNIPKDMLRDGLLNVEVAFQFSSSKETCTGNTQIGNWAVVSRDSFFDIGHRLKNTVDLQSLPYPFSGDQGWRDSAFLLPAEPDSQDLSLLCTFLGLYHQNSPMIDSINIYQGQHQSQVMAEKTGEDGNDGNGGNDGNSGKSRIDGAAGNEALKGLHLIYVGRTVDLPYKNQVHMPFQINPQTGSLQSRDPSFPLLDRLENKVAVMALAPSPVSEDKEILFLTGTDDGSLERLRNSLVQRDTYAKMQGQLAVVDRMGDVHTFLAAPEKPAGSGFMDQLKDWSDQQNNTVFQRIVFIVAFILILGVIGWLLWRMRRRG